MEGVVNAASTTTAAATRCFLCPTKATFRVEHANFTVPFCSRTCADNFCNAVCKDLPMVQQSKGKPGEELIKRLERLSQTRDLLSDTSILSPLPNDLKLVILGNLPLLSLMAYGRTSLYNRAMLNPRSRSGRELWAGLYRRLASEMGANPVLAAPTVPALQFAMVFNNFDYTIVDRTTGVKQSLLAYSHIDATWVLTVAPMEHYPESTRALKISGVRGLLERIEALRIARGMPEGSTEKALSKLIFQYNGSPYYVSDSVPFDKTSGLWADVLDLAYGIGRYGGGVRLELGRRFFVQGAFPEDSSFDADLVDVSRDNFIRSPVMIRVNDDPLSDLINDALDFNAAIKVTRAGNDDSSIERTFKLMRARSRIFYLPVQRGGGTALNNSSLAGTLWATTLRFMTAENGVGYHDIAGGAAMPAVPKGFSDAPREAFVVMYAPEDPAIVVHVECRAIYASTAPNPLVPVALFGDLPVTLWVRFDKVTIVPPANLGFRVYTPANPAGVDLDTAVDVEHRFDVCLPGNTIISLPPGDPRVAALGFGPDDMAALAGRQIRIVFLDPSGTTTSNRIVLAHCAIIKKGPLERELICVTYDKPTDRHIRTVTRGQSAIAATLGC